MSEFEISQLVELLSKFENETYVTFIKRDIINVRQFAEAIKFVPNTEIAG